GAEPTAELERLTRLVYTKGRDVALKRGIIIADTKFEFGRTKSGEILLIDEVMTPDSSRFWPADGYQPGQPQPSFDKQPLRDWLDVERHAGRWNGDAPPPKLPPDVVEATSKRYREAYRRQPGATVVGLDFSGAAIDAARALAGELGLSDRARFVQADLYDAPAALAEPVAFDLVYTSWGVTCWLPDIRRWAEIVAHFLKPRG